MAISKTSVCYFLYAMVAFSIGHHWVAAQTGVPDISLRDIDNQSFSTKMIGQQQATVFVFVNPECPITQHYMPLLDTLQARYRSAGVAVYGIFPPSAYKEDELKQFRTTYQATFPLLVDTRKGKCVRWLQATTTPEVFLLDSTGRIRYQGAIDNRFYALGKRRTQVTEHYLADALEAVLHKTDIKIRQTKALGCLIELTKQ